VRRLDWSFREAPRRRGHFQEGFFDVHLHTHTPIAHQFAKDLPVQRSRRRRALGVLLGGLLLFGLGVPRTVQAQSVTFTTASLQGTYAYVDNVGMVGSVGLIAFDGHGRAVVQIKVNQPDVATGDRTTVSLDGSGTYTVDSTGTGVAEVQFDSVPGQSTYDFVITGTADRRGFSGQPLAREVFAVSRTEGLAGQLVAPSWKRISD
jgi:hypothetical protein